MTPCFATLKRRMLTVTLALFLAQQWLGSAEAVAAGIVPAANAPAANHPLTDTARNGVPIVDIAPPSAAGVSNNQYSQFNTASHGAILNNSAGNVQTQLGGWISGNPLLGPTPAKVILNQVTSGTPSQLLGALEVAGQAADVVVANPAGIACNGCSFINTPHATLTTGAPEFDTAGNLRGFNVTQGVIDVGAGGLDAQQAERLDLDARGLTAEGGIWAHQLGVVAGAADVPYGSTQASAQAGAGNAPEFAVDVSALGGMYADTIDLVATDAGLGVNSQGRLAALQGNLRLAADGKLSLADTSATGA
ncbi:MAG: filamentous hemagglutinin N-terminal domain-containing protein, partial [Betaproteobacteria bacterium]|nr:filamentous hemagglutinin N-terminal domain-containing protein [Betaproteobacteria bacterium]MDE2478133.1 filamentous hemagglutinin N-terminal domain-containing protein [Betaproteobacteria bacterium]